jgi:hypothetical protein
MKQEIRNVPQKSFNGLILKPRGILTSKTLAKVAGIEFIKLLGDTTWETYWFKSNRPLLHEELFNQKPPFKYPIICKLLDDKFILVSIKKNITVYLLKKIFNSYPDLLFRTITIDIDELVKYVANNPQKGYNISYAVAEYPSHISDLRSISFNGQNISNTNIYKEFEHNLNFYYCGIKKQSADGELFKISNDGTIQFYYTDVNKLYGIEEFLKFIQLLNFIK